MDWVKIMCNILDHRKIKMIRKGPEGNTLVLLWLLMLAEAGKCNRGGYLMVSDRLPYTDDTLSMITDIPLPTVQLGLTIFEELNRQYLEERAEEVAQKTLDLDRQAIQMHLGVQLDVVKSEVETRLSTRSYTPEQVERITAAQSERNSLATQLAYDAGLRAHELLTLQPADEQSASTHRQWSDDRFAGRSGVRYTVTGKGGLVREVLVSGQLAARLEEKRFAEPHPISDRGVHYMQHYDTRPRSAEPASMANLLFLHPVRCGCAGGCQR